MDLIGFLLEATQTLGYPGIVLAAFLMFAASPVPTQPVILAAGYLIGQGEMSWSALLIAGTLGAVAGGIVNYLLALTLGRSLLLRLGKYMFIGRESFIRLELFFRRYGRSALFLALIAPGIGQNMTLVAGIAKMPWRPFLFALFPGALIWIAEMLLLGYLFGQRQKELLSLLQSYAPLFFAALILLSSFLWLGRRYFNGRRTAPKLTD